MPKKRTSAATIPVMPTPPEDVVEFGPWGQPPEDANFFMLHKISPAGHVTRMNRTNPDTGVVEELFPVAELDLEWIRSTWGPGTYQTQWYCERNGQRIIRGRGRRFGLSPQQTQVDELGGAHDSPDFQPNPFQPPPPVSPTQSLSETLQILAGLNNLIAQSTNQQMQMVTGLVGAIMQGRPQTDPNTEKMAQALNGVGVILQQFEQRFSALESRLNAEDEEDEPRRTIDMGGSGIQIPVDPESGMGDVVKAYGVKMAMDKLPDILDAAVSYAKGAGENLQAEAEAKRRQAAQAERRQQQSAAAAIEVRTAPPTQPAPPSVPPVEKAEQKQQVLPLDEVSAAATG